MMMLKFKLLAILTFFCLYAYPQDKQKSVETFTNNIFLKHASIGICVKDMEGKNIISYNADQSLTPASILKIITTATAVELLGADFQYKTTLEKQDNQLFVQGVGDPTLGTKFFDDDPGAFLDIWGDEIKKAFSETSKIGITVIDNYFGYDGISSRWVRQDMGSYYAAGAYGISVFDNTFQLFFNTMRRDTCPLIEKMEPMSTLSNITFRNTLKSNTSGRDNGYIVGEPFSNHRLLIGNIPGGRKSFALKGDLPDPGLLLADHVSKTVEGKGMKVTTAETSCSSYYQNMYNKDKKMLGGDVFYTHLSRPLSDIIQVVNFRSNNHYAEHLIRTLGRERNKNIYLIPLDEGVAKINEYWKVQGLDTGSLFMYDGSGLAPSNAVSSDLMCDILVHMQTKGKGKDAFLKSLPQAGKEGTVRNLLKGTRLVGKVYAKSGSIVNVRCYAGYYINGNKKYAFTIMVNGYNGSSSQVVKAIEKLMLGIF